MQNNHQERKLGRGLSSLLGDSKSKKDSLPVLQKNQKTIDLVPLSKIIAGIYQPRKKFDANEIKELSESIKENGIIQPIILRKVEELNKYEIIAGERRFRAASIAGLTEIPAIVKNITDHEALELALIENIQREDLSLREEAEGYKRLIEDFSYHQDQIAKKTGKSRSHIANLLRLLNLPQKVLELLDKNLLSMGHARAIINSDSPEKMAQKIVNNSLTVRHAEELVREEKVDKIKKTPKEALQNRKKSKAKFIDKKHLFAMEKDLSKLLKHEACISYNSLKSSGKIIIKFDDFEKLQKFIKKLGRR